ncbi:hypothetical protein ACSQ67_016517 [Phaseolus vulgaris]
MSSFVRWLSGSSNITAELGKENNNRVLVVGPLGAHRKCVEGDGDLLSDIASRKACHAEGALLQAALSFARPVCFSNAS